MILCAGVDGNIVVFIVIALGVNGALIAYSAIANLMEFMCI